MAYIDSIFQAEMWERFQNLIEEVATDVGEVLCGFGVGDEDKITNPTGRDMRNDDAGAGNYGAARGDRTHDGVDFEAIAGQSVFAPVTGEVTRLGIANRSVDPITGEIIDLGLVEITGDDGNIYTLLYVDPGVAVGDRVLEGTIIGTAEDLQPTYTEDVGDHVHLRIADSERDSVDPTAMVDFCDGGAG